MSLSASDLIFRFAGIAEQTFVPTGAEGLGDVGRQMQSRVSAQRVTSFRWEPPTAPGPPAPVGTKASGLMPRENATADLRWRSLTKPGR